MTHRGSGSGTELRARDINVLWGSGVIILSLGVAELYLVSLNKASNLDSNACSLKHFQLLVKLYLWEKLELSYGHSVEWASVLQCLCNWVEILWSDGMASKFMHTNWDFLKLFCICFEMKEHWWTILEDHHGKECYTGWSKNDPH